MLIAHYPLTGTLEDVSGNNYDLININSVGINDTGKIGKCYETDNTFKYLQTPFKINEIFSDNQDFTLAFWYYHKTGVTLSTGIVNANRYNSEATAGGFGVGAKVSGLTFFCGDDITTIQKDIGYDIFPIQNWHHVTLRYEDGELIGFKNGIEIFNEARTNWLANDEYLKIGINSQGGWGNPSDIKINDVRIYDSALSNKEVYDIAQAKILHYKFNNFQEPTINLYDELNWQGHGLSSWVLTGDTHIGLPVYKNTVTTPSVGNNYGFNSLIDKTLNPNLHSLTLSFWAKLIVDAGTLNTGYVTVYYTDDSTQNHNWSYQPNIFNDFATYQNKWTKVTATVSLNPAKTPSHTTQLYVYKDNAVAGEMDISGIQVEQKDYATPYSIGERDGIVRDSSGFRDDAILELETTPQWSIDSKLGTGSYEFPRIGDKIIKVNDSIQQITYEEITVSTWFKIPNGETQFEAWGGYMISNSPDNSVGNSIYTMASRTNGQITWAWAGTYANVFSPLTYNDGEWHSAIGTWNGTTTILYIDGLEVARYNTTLNRSGGVGKIGIGTNGNTIGYRQFNGSIDDVRIISTALSSEDVYKLAKSRFNIDDKGCFSLNELNNVELSNINIDSNTYNLVTNGNQQTGDNTNFSEFTYINTGETGFEEDIRYATRFTDEFIEFDFRDMNKECFLSFTMKNTSGNGQEHRNYSGIHCYDKHKNAIGHRYVNHYTNTETTLAQDLNNGDTTVYLTSAVNWKTGIDSSSTRFLGIHNLPDYPTYTYTNKTYPFDTSEIIGNTLTLSSPYSGSTVVAGTNVANQYDGGSYLYITSANALLVDGQEETYSTTFDYTTLRYGTKYIKPLMLLNRNVDTGLPYKTLVKDITLEGKYGDFEKDKKVSFQDNGVCRSNIDEIGMIEGLTGYWKFDTLNDSSLEQNDLRNFGVSLSSGIANFDGISSLTTPSNDAVNLDYITMIQVIKINDDIQAGENILISKESSYESRINISTGTATYQSAIMTINNNPNWGWVGSMNVPIGEFVFVATVWNGQKITNYVNDQKIEVDNTSNGTGSMLHTSAGLGIGARGIPSDGSSKGQNFFKGDMKEARIYNRILTDDEVFTLYKIMMKETANIKDNIFYVKQIKEI